MKKAYKDIVLALDGYKELLKDGSINENVYYECLIYSAYEFVVAEFIESAYDTITAIPEAYFSGKFLEHIEGNPQLLERADFVYRALKLAGHVTPPPPPTMPTGRA